MLDKLNLLDIEQFIMLKITVLNVKIWKKVDQEEVIMSKCLIVLEILSNKKMIVFQ